MELFRTLVEQPIFNLLEVIYAIVPGHDLGVAIIIFTALVRIALWPLVRKQLHHTKKMRKLQPELKKIKEAAGGDRQKQARLQMEFYKEQEIKPFSTIGTLIVQIPIFIGLYQAVNRLIKDQDSLQNFSYDWVKDLSWIKHVAENREAFDHTLFGLVDLSQKGLKVGGGIYFAAIVLAAIAALAQYFQSKALMIDQKDSRKLKEILKAAAAGEQTDQAEMTAAVSKGMLIFMPFITFIFSVSIPSALSLYLLTSSVVGFIQQRKILSLDEEEMTEIANEPEKKPSVESATKQNPKKAKSAGQRKKPSSNKKKRRR
jgi:YidC/Oxa1 family membrane protein insertase